MMKITKVKCPTSKYSIKCPYSMKPEGITVHNTYNDASAMSEVSYMIGRPEKVSFHDAVDDYRIVNGLDHNRSCFAAGDGKNGFGNRKTINIEICYSKSGGERFDKAEKLAAQYIAYLLKKYGWGINKVGTHRMRSGKYCPHRTLDRGWKRFLKMIESYMKDNEKKSTSTKVSYYKACNSKYSSISEALKSIGVDGSFSNRKKIAVKNNIKNYTGTAKQNIEMLDKLKHGKLIKV